MEEQHCNRRTQLANREGGLGIAMTLATIGRGSRNFLCAALEKNPRGLGGFDKQHKIIENPRNVGMI